MRALLHPDCCMAMAWYHRSAHHVELVTGRTQGVVYHESQCCVLTQHETCTGIQDDVHAIPSSGSIFLHSLWGEILRFFSVPPGTGNDHDLGASIKQCHAFAVAHLVCSTDKHSMIAEVLNEAL